MTPEGTPKPPILPTKLGVPRSQRLKPGEFAAGSPSNVLIPSSLKQHMAEIHRSMLQS